MRKLSDVYEDEENGILLVKLVDGTYKTYVATTSVERQLRLNRMIKYLGAKRV